MDNEIRSTVLTRDAKICQACGASRAGQVHHILPRGQGGTDDLDNLITLCGRCHMIISPVPPFALRRAFHIEPEEIEAEQARVHKAIHIWQQGGIQPDTGKAVLIAPVKSESEVDVDPQDGVLRQESSINAITSFTVAEAAKDALGVTLEGRGKRFKSPGWFYVGKSVAKCPSCDTTLDGFRKPYVTSANQLYHYWALVCTACKTILEPAELDKNERKALYHSSELRPKQVNEEIESTNQSTDEDIKCMIEDSQNIDCHEDCDYWIDNILDLLSNVEAPALLGEAKRRIRELEQSKASLPGVEKVKADRQYQQSVGARLKLTTCAR
jgi:hypothetical protein